MKYLHGNRDEGFGWILEVTQDVGNEQRVMGYEWVQSCMRLWVGWHGVEIEAWKMR